MQGFNEKIPQKCVEHLLYIINYSGHSMIDALTYVFGYCEALKDIAILTNSEWLQTYELCSEMIYENEIHPKNHPKQG